MTPVSSPNVSTLRERDKISFNPAFPSHIPFPDDTVRALECRNIKNGSMYITLRQTQETPMEASKQQYEQGTCFRADFYSFNIRPYEHYCLKEYAFAILANQLRIAIRYFKTKFIYVPRLFTAFVRCGHSHYYQVFKEAVSLLPTKKGIKYIHRLPRKHQRQLADELCQLVEATALTFIGKNPIPIGKIEQPNGNTRYYLVLCDTFGHRTLSIGEDDAMIKNLPLHDEKVMSSYIALRAIFARWPKFLDSTFAKHVIKRIDKYEGHFNTRREDPKRYDKVMANPEYIASRLTPSEVYKSTIDESTGITYSPQELIEIHRRRASQNNPTK